MARYVLIPILLYSASTFAEEPPETRTFGFRAHVLHAESEFSACAALDVNGDGKLDIVNGGYWYEAPGWKQHKLRDVEMIRGRYDDYSNLPLDVNRDGKVDLVSVNYRSQKIFWIENPGQVDKLWTSHTVAAPGSSETGRLADVDGDGQLDILPNGTKFAAWWRIEGVQDGQPQFVRYDLPQELAGHGVGIGDLNGDGRADLVGPRGWAEAPPDRLKDRWVFHPDFELHRDCGLPILVFDVDDDGDGDIVWGRGHNIGLYWMEQRRRDGEPSQWELHAIDTSWSGLHSLLLGDLDGDGRQEVIAGKRYMGHDGNDPGEYDPLQVVGYQFQPKQRTWRRQPISYSTRIGFGLDPTLADVDADGDLDLICPGRSGLYWLENVRADSTSKSEKQSADASETHRDQLLQFKPDFGRAAVTEVKNPLAWAGRRHEILERMQRVMGPLPDSSRRVPLDVKIVEEQQTEHYRRIRLTYAAEPGDRVPAWLLIPNDLKAKAPAMLCLHSTMKRGKDSVVGLDGPVTRHTADQLAKRGYVCLAPDYPSFGEYAGYDFSKDDYTSGTMKAIWNNIRGIDLLEARPEVDRDRIGVIGHSLGGHNALFTAAFDQRLRAIVSSCGYTAFHNYYGGKLAGWTSDRYMPAIREQYENDPDRVPFDFYEVVAALAPRPFFANAPLHDSNFDVEGVRKITAEVSRVYKLLGKPQALRVVHPDCEHDFPDEIRGQAYDFLDQALR